MDTLDLQHLSAIQQDIAVNAAVWMIQRHDGECDTDLSPNDSSLDAEGGPI